MPRYFFHIQDGEVSVDSRGTELRDLSAARREVLRFASTLLLDYGDDFWDCSEWVIRVADEDDLTLFTLLFLGTDFATEYKPRLHQAGRAQ